MMTLFIILFLSTSKLISAETREVIIDASGASASGESCHKQAEAIETIDGDIIAGASGVSSSGDHLIQGKGSMIDADEVNLMQTNLQVHVPGNPHSSKNTPRSTNSGEKKKTPQVGAKARQALPQMRQDTFVHAISEEYVMYESTVLCGRCWEWPNTDPCSDEGYRNVNPSECEEVHLAACPSSSTRGSFLFSKLSEDEWGPIQNNDTTLKCLKRGQNGILKVMWEADCNLDGDNFQFKKIQIDESNEFAIYTIKSDEFSEWNVINACDYRRYKQKGFCDYANLITSNVSDANLNSNEGNNRDLMYWSHKNTYCSED
eukprot:gnl/MRDRNA2_/MRDRNA2_89772_c0_seq1.p1 gnl/MRDRNA2_/MRDRNA2_89772_c0~~gnl/MRDRNA2_/MRDRNA2_89772_c0_seq1.p1  ORF type:complete len:317 (-),score=43.14 gnl/MRDRNA2_/MRDRNA2_89772_c0_seq1:40-990(-)